MDEKKLSFSKAILKKRVLLSPFFVITPSNPTKLRLASFSFRDGSIRLSIFFFDLRFFEKKFYFF